jgi:hypothetical protein
LTVERKKRDFVMAITSHWKETGNMAAGDRNSAHADRRTAMALNSSSLWFRAGTVGRTAVAALALAGALAATPALAGDAVALIESLAGQSQRVELMKYAHAGQVIRLGPDQTLVLSYKDSCVRETITGGTVTIGTDQSEVRSGEVTRMRGQCVVGRVDITDGQVSVGGRSFRGLTH